MNAASLLAASFGQSDFVFPLLLTDLTTEICIRRLRDNGGPSIAYNLGHLLHYRHEILRLVGQDATSPYAEKFGYSVATDGSDYPTVDEFRAAWGPLAERVQAALAKVTDAQLDADLPQGTPFGKTLGAALQFFLWHEVYHMGQAGTLRAHYGLTPVSTLAMQLMQKG